MWLYLMMWWSIVGVWGTHVCPVMINRDRIVFKGHRCTGVVLPEIGSQSFRSREQTVLQSAVQSPKNVALQKNNEIKNELSVNRSLESRGKKTHTHTCTQIIKELEEHKCKQELWLVLTRLGVAEQQVSSSPVAAISRRSMFHAKSQVYLSGSYASIIYEPRRFFLAGGVVGH